MKKMRKLIPAFAMLMVAAIMMSTASFAWFSMSAEVTASGMSVKAQATTGLVMSALVGPTGATPETTDYVTSVDFTAKNGTGDSATPLWYTNGATAINPASIDDGVLYTATAENADSHVAAQSGYTKVGDTDVKANATAYLATKLYFMGLTETDQELTINSLNVSFDKAGTNLNKALRVALKVTAGEDTAWFYFAPNHTAGTADLVHTTSTTSGETTTFSTKGYGSNFLCGAIPTATPVVLSDALNSTSAITAEVYIYFEGEDPNCKSVLAFDLSTITINMTFGTAE